MNIATRELASLDDFAACERLQLELVGGWERLVIPPHALVTIGESGGILIGAHDPDSGELHGVLIDLIGIDSGRGIGFTLFFGVRSEARNRGIGQSLRRAERRHARRAGIPLIRFPIDPLRGIEAHLACNRLGGVGVGYVRNLYGPLPDPADGGLATDRILVEWWIDSPRVNAVVDAGLLPPHYRLGLDRMEVVTKTRAVGGGVRQLLEFNSSPASDVILVEVPVDFDRLLAGSPKLARDWRLKTREVFELFFTKGYLLTGFVHEAGRSFHLLERRRKAAVLEEGG